MTTTRLVLLAALATLACEPAGRDALTTEHASAIADSVQAVLAGYGEVVSAGDWDGAVSYYADDPRFQWWEDGRLAYSSVDEVRTAMRSLEATFKSSELKLSDTRIVPLAPGVAAVNTLYQQTLTDTAGVSFSFGGAITLTTVHTSSGWKFLVGHASTERTRGQ